MPHIKGKSEVFVCLLMFLFFLFFLIIYAFLFSTANSICHVGVVSCVPYRKVQVGNDQ